MLFTVYAVVPLRGTTLLVMRTFADHELSALHVPQL
jgi:hypothetical protein